VFFSFLVATRARYGVSVDLEDLVPCSPHSVREIVGVSAVVSRLHVINSVAFDSAPYSREVASLLEALNGCLPACAQPKMPASEPREDEPDYATDNTEHYDVDGCKIFKILIRGEKVVPHPIPATAETNPAEDARIDQEEHKRLVIVYTDTGCEPRAMMVHL
jgi:hypothetical protein